MQTVDVLPDPGFEPEAFDGRGDCEGQIPEGSDGVPGVVEDQPSVEEQIDNGVGWGRSRGFRPQGEDWRSVSSSGTPVTLVRVERCDVHGVDTMIWRLAGCGRVSASSEGGVGDVYCMSLGGSLGSPSDRRFHGGRLVVSPVHFRLPLSR